MIYSFKLAIVSHSSLDTRVMLRFACSSSCRRSEVRIPCWVGTGKSIPSLWRDKAPCYQGPPASRAPRRAFHTDQKDSSESNNDENKQLKASVRNAGSWPNKCPQFARNVSRDCCDETWYARSPALGNSESKRSPALL